MTTTEPAGQDRAAAVALLRAVADLIESRPDLPDPSARVHFYVCGEHAVTQMTAIAEGLPCGWQSEVRHGDSGRAWLDLDSTPQPSSILRGTRVDISAPVGDVCVPAGIQTVPVWQPAAALAGLAGSGPASERRPG
ncbi:MAG TPA: hypothetical protein VGH27_03870 [Streptosporangiaceae bacterium]|jgi:hypothetical protein